MQSNLKIKNQISRKMYLGQHNSKNKYLHSIRASIIDKTVKYFKQTLFTKRIAFALSWYGISLSFTVGTAFYTIGSRTGAMPMIKAVFFDLYQTLVRYQPSQEELEADALKSLNISVSAAALKHPIFTANEYIARQLASRPLSRRTREEVIALYSEYQRIVLKEAGLAAEEKVVLRLLGMMQQVKMDLVLFDDVLPALDGLKKRGPITGLISNIEKDMTDTLDKLGLSARLDIVVTSQDAGFTKPQREIFQYALKKAGIMPAAAVYVGDQYQVDVIGANGAGMQGILLDREDYYQTTDCPKIKSLKDLGEYLN
jgi:putative hydrolase of the HAD superfamily